MYLTCKCSCWTCSTSQGVVSSPTDVVLLLLLRGKATVDKVEALFTLFEEVLLRGNLSNQRRAVEILKESKARKYVCLNATTAVTSPLDGITSNSSL